MQLLAVNIKYVQALHHGRHGIGLALQSLVGLALVAELVAPLHPMMTSLRFRATVLVVTRCCLVSHHQTQQHKLSQSSHC